MEVAQDCKVRMGRGVKMISNCEIQHTLLDQAQVFSEIVTKSTLGLTNVKKKATSGTPDSVIKVSGGVCKPPGRF